MTYRDIISTTAKHFDLTVHEMLNGGRAEYYEWPRSCAVYLCKQNLRCNFSTIDRYFGRSISWAKKTYKRINKLPPNDKRRLDVQRIQEELNNGHFPIPS